MAVRRLLPIAMVVIVSAACCGQLHGTPPSITSIRPGTGVSNFPVPSVTSMGPNGWDALSTSEIPPFNADPQVPLDPQFSHHRHHPGASHTIGNRGFRTGVVPAIVPYYVPYYLPAPAYPLIYPAIAAPAASSEDSAPDYETQASDPPADPPAADPPATPAVAVAPAPVSPLDPPANATTAQAQAQAQEEATVLIFRNGRQLEVHNYAIVGDQVFNFSNSGPRRIPLDELDIAATQRANDDRGVEFQVPVTGGN